MRRKKFSRQSRKDLHVSEKVANKRSGHLSNLLYGRAFEKKFSLHQTAHVIEMQG